MINPTALGHETKRTPENRRDERDSGAVRKQTRAQVSSMDEKHRASATHRIGTAIPRGGVPNAEIVAGGR